jgi:hypothetical protein
LSQELPHVTNGISKAVASKSARRRLPEEYSIRILGGGLDFKLTFLQVSANGLIEAQGKNHFALFSFLLLFIGWKK